MRADRPTEPVTVPDVVARRAHGRVCEAVWKNELGGLTFRIGAGHDAEFMKWHPDRRGIDLHAEADRLTWASPYVAVPRVIALGDDGDAQWLVTAPLVGETAVSERWTASPAVAAAAIGQGLRTLHDYLPVTGCPFIWTASARRARARGHRDPLGDASADGTTEVAPITPELWAVLESPPPEDLVVCHGDACAPNTLVGDDGACSGHVDMGRLGVGDRWADLAVAAWSTEWNYGPGYENVVYDAYGVERDEEKIRYYRLLWDVD